CGKVVVATSPDELPRLEELHRRGTANGVPGLELIGRERLLELEPHAAGIRALHSPETAIVDFSVVARADAEDVVALGGEIRTACEVTGIRRLSAGVTVSTTGGEVEARHVVACAGVQADRVASLSGGATEPRILPFRGGYWVPRPEARHLPNGPLSPVPAPSFPFLGVHFTARLDGAVLLGPS